MLFSGLFSSCATPVVSSPSVASWPAWTSCSCLSRSSCSRRSMTCVVERRSPMMWIIALRLSSSLRFDRCESLRMCSIALRWSPSRRFDSFRSPMMWISARRRSSAWLTRSWSSSICSSSAAASSPRRCGSGCADIALGAVGPECLDFGLEALELLLERDHLQLAADDDLLELLEVEDLVLELGLGLLEVAHDGLVLTHVAEHADRTDHVPVSVRESGGVERRGDDLAGRRARVQARVAGHATLDDLAQGGRELARLLDTDEARERLFDDLVSAEAEQLGDGVVGLEDLALEVGDEHVGGGVLDQALGVGARLVQLAQDAEDGDRSDHAAVGIAQRGGVERGGDDFAGRGARVEARVAGHSALDDLAQGGRELARLLLADEAGERLLDDLVSAEAEELGDGVVRLEDLALEIRDEHGVGRVLDQALGVGARLVQLAHVAEHADRADHVAVGVAQRRSVQRRRDHLARGATGIEDRVPRDAALDDLAQGGRELARLLGADEARQRLLDDLVLAEAEELRDRVVRLEDLALEVGDEHGVRGVLDDDVRDENLAGRGAVPLRRGAVSLYRRCRLDGSLLGHSPSPPWRSKSVPNSEAAFSFCVQIFRAATGHSERLQAIPTAIWPNLAKSVVPRVGNPSFGAEYVRAAKRSTLWRVGTFVRPLVCPPRRRRFLLKQIHPELMLTTVRCTSCGTTFTTRSTRRELVVDTCSNCHPAYTGVERAARSGSRIERFERRRQKARA